MPGKINQVICNLLLNAIQAIPEKGTVSLSTSYNPKTSYVVLCISDTGPGIPESIRRKIFDPFFTTKEVGKGTGLGLSISYEIMRSHQGKLYYNSEENKGTQFFIELPVVVS